jgi:hypothetical protein
VILTKILYEFLISPTRATFPTHLILFDFIILIIGNTNYGGRHYETFSYCCLFPLNSKYILFGALFSNTLNRYK